MSGMGLSPTAQTALPNADVDLDVEQATARALSGVVVLIPAWQPDARLEALVGELRQAQLLRLVLVDDGSGPQSEALLERLAALPEVALCRHTENRGKGRALKTGFQYVLGLSPAVTGVVTADADGQHLAADIVLVARRLAATFSRPVLGVRDFAGKVPWRSRFGNGLARRIFAWRTGCDVQDTQTGLRGLPVTLLPALMALPGERYDYETVMLLYLCCNSGVPDEIAIRTVYLDKNRSSHFHPLQDSLQVYRALLRGCSLLGPNRGHRAGATKKPHLRPV